MHFVLLQCNVYMIGKSTDISTHSTHMSARALTHTKFLFIITRIIIAVAIIIVFAK